METVPESIGPYLYQPHTLVRETRMSLVWIAMTTDAASHRPNDSEAEVVLKVARMTEKNYSLANQQAIENEEDWLRKLRHPGIIKLRPIAEDRPLPRRVYRARTNLEDQPWFVVMDYLPGGTLTELIHERRRLSVPLSLQIAHHVADALAYAHAKGCVHRDIKPNNVLFRQKPGLHGVDEDSYPVVIDFGIAAENGHNRRVIGTRNWMAPEAESAMRQGNSLPSDPSWDIYALGLVLYNMVTGIRPSVGVPQVPAQVNIPASVVRNDRTVPRRASAAMTTGLNELIRRSVSNIPDERPSAEEFKKHVQYLLTLVQTEQSPLRRWPVWIPVGVGGAALTLIAVVLLRGMPIDQNDGAAGDPPAPITATVEPADGGLVAGAPITTTVGTATPVATITSASMITSAPTMATAAEEPTVAAPETPAPTEPVPTQETPIDEAEAPATSVPLEPVISAATSTPLPTSTTVPPTATVARPTATPRPTSTATATVAPARDTSTPTATATVPTPTSPPPPPSPIPRSVALGQPTNGANWGHQQVTFSWTPNFSLGPGEQFEVVLWKPGDDAFTKSYSVTGATRETELNVSFSDELDDLVNERLQQEFLMPGEFMWSVLLVRTEPGYERIRLLHPGRSFTYTD